MPRKPPTVPDMTFGAWLEATAALQEQAYGIRPAELLGAARADYLRSMTLAAVVELAEAAQETYWKPWGRADGTPRRDRDRVLEELVDVLHFLGNLLVAQGVTGPELTAAYLAKAQVNRDRQVTGYAG